MSINTWCTVGKENTWTSSLVSILSRVFTFSPLFFCFLFHFVLQLRPAQLDLALVCQLWLCFWVKVLFLILESVKKTVTWFWDINYARTKMQVHENTKFGWCQKVNLHNAMSCTLHGLYSYLTFTELHENATERHFTNGWNSECGLKGTNIPVSPRWTYSFRFHWN